MADETEFGNVGATKDYFDHASELKASNDKRAYDAHQDLDLARARNQEAERVRGAQLGATNDQQLHSVALQALQNAVKHSDQLTQQTVSAIGSAQDRLINLPENELVLRRMLGSEGQVAALENLMVQAVGKALASQDK